MRLGMLSTLLAAGLAAAPAGAQDKGSVNPKPLPPLANPDDPATPAKALFGRKTAPSAQQAKVVGFYAKGCLAGAEAVPYDGEAWQVMRISRNRNWGHPELVKFMQRKASQLRRDGVWSGFLVGDMSQPRGGPMLTGHASHQIGLDADVWLTQMPNRTDRKSTRLNSSHT